MKRLASVGLAVVGLLGSSLAQAQDDRGFYLGGSVGLTKLDSGNTAQDTANSIVALGFSSAQVTVDESSKGFKVFAGYQFNRHLAVEGFYSDLGSFDVSIATTGPATSIAGDVSVKGFGADLVGIYPASETVSIFGKVGVFSWDSDTSLRGTGGAAAGQSASASESGSDAKFGLGADWKLGKNVRLRTEWEYYNFDTAVSMLSIGLLYRF
jgi:OOP family OmpA-OmpF porin